MDRLLKLSWTLQEWVRSQGTLLRHEHHPFLLSYFLFVFLFTLLKPILAIVDELGRYGGGKGKKEYGIP